MGVYFRFLSTQKAMTPMIAITTTAMSMAISVVMNGASVGSVGSGSIGPEGAAAGPTATAVSAYEAKSR